MQDKKLFVCIYIYNKINGINIERYETKKKC